MRDALEESFYVNTGPGVQLLVCHLVERNSFTLAEAHTQLEAVVAREIPLRVIEDILRQLELYGLAAANMSGHYGWAIPLLRERLLTGPERPHRLTRLLRELPAEYDRWVTPEERF